MSFMSRILGLSTRSSRFERQTTSIVNVDYNYDSDRHFAPPIRIQWIARNQNRLTQERWIFIHCCGQTGTNSPTNVISSVFPCKPSIGDSVQDVTKHHHAGPLELLRITHNQVVTRTPPLARWTCCGKEIPPWNDAWSSRDRRIPFQYVDSGCLDGMYDCNDEARESPSERCSVRYQRTAIVAKPLNRKPKAHSGRTKSHVSSGRETFIIEKEKLMNPCNINFTQKSVLKQFSDKTLPSVLDTAVLIQRGKLKVEDLPILRVASRSNSEDDDFYTADNRRLFLFRILDIKQILVEWIQWTSEFDDKLRQNIRFDPETRFYVTEESISTCRRIFYDNLVIGRKLMNPCNINFTQKSVLKHFSDKTLPSVLDTAVLIQRGELKVEDLPLLRVASRSNSEDDDFYTADNRRLFLFRILDIKKINVEWIQWTSEFDDKLRQNIRFDPETRFYVTEESISTCREICAEKLVIGQKFMKLCNINFTQKSVLKHFSDKTLPSVLDTAVLIQRGKLKVKDLPILRVASRSNSEDDDFYTADNRRLFLFRILDIKKINVEWIQWTSEFDDKLRQNIRFDPETRFYVTEESISTCREICADKLVIEKEKIMNPSNIHFTKKSILKNIDNDPLPSILGYAVMILRGEFLLENIPPIRVATKSNMEEDEYYSPDNRHLFLYRVLGIEKVKVTWIKWIVEFDIRLLISNSLSHKPLSNTHFDVTEESISACRSICYNKIILEEEKILDPREIRFTQNSILKVFDDKSLPSILDTADLILRQQLNLEMIPVIRVATRSNSKDNEFHTCDNRRLFLYRIIDAKEIKVKWICWTPEFDKTDDQHKKFDPKTHLNLTEDEISACKCICFNNVVIQEEKLMNPRTIKFTQKSVLKNFDDKSLPSILDAVVQIMKGELRIDQIPMIQVATMSNRKDDKFYSCNNRRLFLLKILNIKEIQVQCVQWNSDFHDKLWKIDNIQFDENLHFSVTNNSISSCRSICYKSLVIQEEMMIEPCKIKFTLNFISKSFNDGSLPSIIDIAVMILRGEFDMKKIPTIRVATKSNSGKDGFYTCDNRRLFLYLLLDVDKVKVEWIHWIKEFDDKLREIDILDDSKTHFNVDHTSIWRKYCYQKVIIKDGQVMDSRKIKFTYQSVLKCFDDKSFQSILDTALMIIKGELEIENIPIIRVASKSNSIQDDFYTIDNRRLFLYRVLEQKEIRVKWIYWTSEFDEIQKQNIEFNADTHFHTDEESILDCTRFCYKSFIIQEEMIMDPLDVKFSVKSFPNKFDDERLPSITDTAVLILKGKFNLQDVPLIRVATQNYTNDEKFYTVNNKRLFLYRLLGIKKIKVNWIKWTTEFDAKFKHNVDLDLSACLHATEENILACKRICFNKLIIQENKSIDPRNIRFSQESILRNFDQNDLPSILETAVLLLKGKLSLNQIPLIWVATRSNTDNDEFYTWNNRRLFLYRILNIKEIKVRWIYWTSEFDEKLKQHFKFDAMTSFRVAEKDISECRKICQTVQNSHISFKLS